MAVKKLIYNWNVVGFVTGFNYEVSLVHFKVTKERMAVVKSLFKSSNLTASLCTVFKIY